MFIKYKCDVTFLTCQNTDICMYTKNKNFKIVQIDTFKNDIEIGLLPLQQDRVLYLARIRLR